MSTNGSDFVIEGHKLVAYRDNETHLVIPDGVRTIGAGAFSGNNCIRTVDLNEVSYVKSRAFEDCSALETVVVHGHLQDVGTRAFAGCRSLRSIECAPDEEWPAAARRESMSTRNEPMRPVAPATSTVAPSSFSRPTTCAKARSRSATYAARFVMDPPMLASAASRRARP